MEESNPVAIMPANVDAGNQKMNRQPPLKRKGRSCFEWIQLVATIWIPIVIAIYTVVENKSNESIASTNRLKDIDIANANRQKDIDIANISRKLEYEIAQAQRLNELAIAELSRQKDRDLSTDQQQQNILIEHQSFLAKLMIDHGANLTKNVGAKLAANFMTRTALNQLDTPRRSILLRSLYYSNLIIAQKKDMSRTDTSVIIDLEQADLSNMRFGIWPGIPYELQRDRYIAWRYLWLPNTNLTNASFRHTTLDCATFSRALMDSADLSYAAHYFPPCLGILQHSQTDFTAASLVNAILYKVNFFLADFSNADLTSADLRGSSWRESTFSSARLHLADLSFSRFFSTFAIYQERLNFHAVNLSRAVVRSAWFHSIEFRASDWSNADASEINIFNCSFSRATLDNSSFAKSLITTSFFWNASLSMINLSDAVLNNVSFVNANMHKANLSNIRCEYCDFRSVSLYDAVLRNASFIRSNFRDCRLNTSQLEEAADLSGSTLPNGTVVRMNA